jgi:hypothetical protein
VSPLTRRDPCLPSRGSRLRRLARHSLIALAACLAVALAVMVASGIGQVELLVLIALVLLLWPRILGRIRDPKARFRRRSTDAAGSTPAAAEDGLSENSRPP